MPRFPRSSAVRPCPSPFRTRGLARLARVAAAAVACVALVSADPVRHADATTEPTTSEEYRVKAAFLYNFIKYTSWPAAAFEEEESPIVVAIVGDDPFGDVLDATMKGKRVGGRSLQISRLAQVPDDVSAHIAFTDSKSKVGREYVQNAARHPVLVVDDRDGTVKSGAQVGFYVASGRVRFEVNLSKVKESDLTISSELLKLARIVGKTNEVAR